MAFARLNEASIEPERLTWEELSLLALSNAGGEAIRFRIRSMIAVLRFAPAPENLSQRLRNLAEHHLPACIANAAYPLGKQ